jgi:hypothetical protein
VKVYIAGPMTNLPDLNLRAFFDAEAALLAAGYEVLNPARNDCAGWLPCMRAALRQIAECDGLALLDGWEKSIGASIERNLVSSLNLPVKTLDEWLEEAAA